MLESLFDFKICCNASAKVQYLEVQEEALVAGKGDHSVQGGPPFIWRRACRGQSPPRKPPP